MDIEFYIKAEDNTAKTIPYTNQRSRALTIITSRGCPYRCIFCHNSWRPTPVRYHSADRVIHEIEFLVSKYCLDSLFFADDEFLANSARLKIICQELINKKINQKVVWGCQARSDVIERLGTETLKLIKNAGCALVAIGFESGSQTILDFLKNKQVTVEQNKKAAALCKEVGLKVSASFMLGTPTETKEDILATLKFIEENQDNLDFVGVGITTPYPGTILWQWCLDHKLISPNIDYSILCPDPRFGLADGRIIFDTMSKEKFKEIFKKIQDKTRELNFSKQN